MAAAAANGQFCSTTLWATTLPSTRTRQAQKSGTIIQCIFDGCNWQILVSGISANFSRNLVAHNVGWHTVDTQIPEGGADSAQMHFLDNFFEENLALGHGNPYMERYGFHQGREVDEFTSRRPKRQVGIKY